MAKTSKKLLWLLAIVCLLLTVVPTVSAADETMQISLRVEGVNACLYSDTLTLPADATAADALTAAKGLTVVGLDEGYITAINGESAGQFGGWDGWMYLVNGKAPSVGMPDQTLANGDVVVVYYGDFPCQVPVMDTARLNSDGVLAFTSADTVYDENFNASTVINPVVDATVTIGDKTYTTDDKGEVAIDLANGTYAVQIAKKSASGAPAVLRFAADTNVTVARATQAAETTTTDNRFPTETTAAAETTAAVETTSAEAADTTATTAVPEAGETARPIAAVLLLGAAGVVLLATTKRKA